MTDISTSASIAGPIETVVAACTPKVKHGLFRRMIIVWRQRQQLDRLPQHLRRDIGLSDAQISQEVQRPLWDAPHHWRL